VNIDNSDGWGGDGGVADGLIAGKPAPTEVSATAGFVCRPETCGSWLASDEADAATVNIH